MRKIIVYIAASADGYIARADGSVDWLSGSRQPGDYGWAKFYATIDTILWGRKTYEFGLSAGFPFDPDVKNYLFSRQKMNDPGPGFELVDDSVSDFAERIRAIPGKNIWMMGGGELISSFLDVGQIDEFIIHVIPVLIGEGIPLLAPRHRTVSLQLESCRQFEDGVIRLHYSVLRSEMGNEDPHQGSPGQG